ncbi:hypothetical protein ACOI1C_22485 [Bacillus sp. DJP31]|uniref:hypothetical protein n=1 Tax=Bacillus sp. DJP31 TaxID=3409789 RepID=UPI003BB4C639
MKKFNLIKTLCMITSLFVVFAMVGTSYVGAIGFGCEDQQSSVSTFSTEPIELDPREGGCTEPPGTGGELDPGTEPDPGTTDPVDEIDEYYGDFATYEEYEKDVEQFFELLKLGELDEYILDNPENEYGYADYIDNSSIYSESEINMALDELMDIVNSDEVFSQFEIYLQDNAELYQNSFDYQKALSDYHNSSYEISPNVAPFVVVVLAVVLRHVIAKVGKKAAQKALTISRPYVNQALKDVKRYDLRLFSSKSRLIAVIDKRSTKKDKTIFALDYHPYTEGSYKSNGSELHYHIGTNLKKHYRIYY